MNAAAQKCRACVFDAIPKINMAQFRLLVLLRKELAFEIDQERYLKFMEAQNTEAARAMSEIRKVLAAPVA
jgi:hypothetical protein